MTCVRVTRVRVTWVRVTWVCLDYALAGCSHLSVCMYVHTYVCLIFKPILYICTTSWCFHHSLPPSRPPFLPPSLLSFSPSLPPSLSLMFTCVSVSLVVCVQRKPVQQLVYLQPTRQLLALLDNSLYLMSNRLEVGVHACTYIHTYVYNLVCILLPSWLWESVL